MLRLKVICGRRVDFMELVFLTAAGVGGATLIGAILGFLFKNVSHKFSDVVMGLV